MVKATCLDISFGSGQLSKNQICPFFWLETFYAYIYDAIATILNVVDFQLKNGHIQGTLKQIVKIPCIYHVSFRRSIPDNISTKIQNGCNFEFQMQVKMIQNQFEHLQEQVYQIACKSGIFEKSPIMTSCRPSQKFHKNESNVKSLGTPLCI